MDSEMKKGKGKESVISMMFNKSANTFDRHFMTNELIQSNRIDS